MQIQHTPAHIRDHYKFLGLSTRLQSLFEDFQEWKQSQGVDIAWQAGDWKKN
jgi:hypothetical protein